MAWPFSHVVAPNLTSGQVQLPSSSTLVTGVPATSTPIWLMGVTLMNTTAAAMTVSMTDGSDVAVLTAIEIPGNSVFTQEFPFRPLTGLKWSASAATGMRGHVWGYY